MKKLSLSIVVVIAAFLWGCGSQPEGVIAQGDMVDLMADMHKAEAVIDMNSAQFNNDSLKKTMRQSVLMKHGVTQAQFDTTMVWYGHHAKKYGEMYDEVIDKLDEEGRELSNIKGPIMREGMTQVKRYPSAGDSADVWSKRRVWIVSNEGTSDNTIFFDFKTQSDNQNGDRYHLSFKFTNSNNNRLEVFVGADYYDGTLSYIYRESGTEGVNRYVLQGDSTKKVRRVFGYIKADPDDGDVCFIDSLQMLRTRFNSSLYGSFKQQKWVGPHNLDPEYRALVKANPEKQKAKEVAAEAAEKRQAEIDAQRRVQRRNYRVRPQEENAKVMNVSVAD